MNWFCKKCNAQGDVSFPRNTDGIQMAEAVKQAHHLVSPACEKPELKIIHVFTCPKCGKPIGDHPHNTACQ